MKFLLTLLLAVILISSVFSNGIGITDAKNALYLTLKNSHVEVKIENQVAIVTTTQTFKNELGKAKKVKYAFPMPEDASATELKYQVGNKWYLARFSPVAADTSLPHGSETHPNLNEFLGETPLYYNIDQTIGRDSILVIRLSYVQLLPYEFGSVKFFYPNNYSLIQSGIVSQLSFDVYLNSDRTVNSLELIGLEPTSQALNSNDAELHYSALKQTADFNYEVQFTLSLDELGLFDMSTAIADSLVPDDHGSGFFTFVAEPDQHETIIEKVFTLIIDRSGSMGGNKIRQARDASAFIVENLNEGDQFNIIDFSSGVRSFRNSHVPFNDKNMHDALSYIQALIANGGTNISGAFGTAIPQFSSAKESTANIIIFFTDGQATAGITNTPGILDHVRSSVNTNKTEIMIFTFGIGGSVNTQLLTLLATENNGLAEFLGNAELESRISSFYLTIRNPVLLNTEMSFSPAIVDETYPQVLPSLYLGKQLVISGRYQQALPVTVTLSGNAFGRSVQYEYEMQLSDSTIDNNRFLTKIWAKRKIEHLLIEYYSEENEARLEALHTEIVTISMDYGVLSPLTSFSGSDLTSLEESIYQNEGSNQPIAYMLLGNYPNPFNPSTTIQFQVNINLQGIVTLKIYNSLGQIVRVLDIYVSGKGLYEIHWDGLLQTGLPASSGNYFYIFDLGDALLSGKMTLMK